VRLALALVLVGGSAAAGGLVRPNGISARGVGMGGAWVAWADDATATFFNPAALDVTSAHVLLGGELVYGPRSYVPLETDGTHGPSQDAATVAPVPSVGIVGRFSYDDRPSRFTLGLGMWNTFGGEIRYAKTGMPALDTIQDVCLEIDGAASLRISDRLAIGGGFRFGIGQFHIESTMSPFDANLSASGVGVGMIWGAVLRPTDAVRVGLSWHSPLRITTKGSGTIDFGSGAERHDVLHEQTWPQQVSLGVGWQVRPELRLATQLDWTEWSMIDEIVVSFPASSLPDQVDAGDWRDTWTGRLGGEYAVSSALAVRGGAYFDTAAVPDRTLTRQYTDANKLGLSAGASLRAAPWRFDAAIDGVIPHTRTVPDNSADVQGVPALANKAPGDYRGTLLTLELAVARQF
jgi:long-chain fatty acid transport protein